MKKLMMLMLVALFMLGVSGQAMAAFEEGHLIRVTYNLINGQGTEFATDLGDFTGLYSPITSNNLLAGQDTFSLSKLNAADWSQAKVGYFIYSFTGQANNGGAWSSGRLTNSGFALPTGLGAFYNGTTLPAALWQSIAGTQGLGTNSAQNSQTNTSSYYTWAGYEGSFGGFLDTAVHVGGEVSLAALATVGYVDQYLYYYGADPNVGGQGTALATIRTFANGTTQLLALAAPAVPIPAAAYLFGSGLLGLFGLRRKMAA
jgi:hypothetical protein